MNFDWWWNFAAGGLAGLMLVCIIGSVWVVIAIERRRAQGEPISRILPEMLLSSTGFALVAWFAFWKSAHPGFWNGFWICGLLFCLAIKENAAYWIGYARRK